MFVQIVHLVLVTFDVLIEDRYDSSSGEAGCQPIGLSFIKLAASKQSNPGNVIILSSIADVIALLTDLISASDIPFYHGASLTKKIHLTPCVTPNC